MSNDKYCMVCSSAVVTEDDPGNGLYFCSECMDWVSAVVDVKEHTLPYWRPAQDPIARIAELEKGLMAIRALPISRWGEKDIDVYSEQIRDIAHKALQEKPDNEKSV